MENDIIEDTIECVKKFVDILNYIDNEWNSLYDQIGRLDQETSDLLHEIELTEFDAVEGFQLSTEIKKIRIKRRDLKDYQEVIKYLKDFSDRNKSLRISLFKTANLMQKTRDYHYNRRYTPRVREDLKLSIKDEYSYSEYLADADEEMKVYNELEERMPIIEGDVEENIKDYIEEG